MTYIETTDLLYDCKLAAEYVGKSVPTLARWRALGDGPDYVKIGRAIKYRKSARDRFIEECTRRPHRRPPYGGG
uniref:helix-turn-helix transcriptional regulator n=1 Tax=Methylocystis sp. TaxID=1911079 RepID=UPI003D0CA2F1